MKILEKSILLTFLVFGNTFTIKAQSKPTKQFNTKKWVHIISVGNSKYSYKGIIPSRNLVNYNYNKGMNAPSNKTTGGGLVLEGKIVRKIGKKNYLGISFNYYKDFNCSWNNEQTIYAVKSSKLNYLTIYDNQSYVNIGFTYQRQLIKLLSDRITIDGSFTMGYSINGTPLRMEYDYYENGLHEVQPADANGVAWYLQYTDFYDGSFINPSIVTRFNMSQHHGFLLEFSGVMQWHMFSQSVGVNPGLPKSAYESARYNGQTEFKYTVKGLQLKLGYFF